eukprot:2253597-Prymnesium_polylepis.1
MTKGTPSPHNFCQTIGSGPRGSQWLSVGHQRSQPVEYVQVYNRASSCCMVSGPVAVKPRDTNRHG